MSKGRLAIQFFGHSRTYKKTYESFFKYIVEPNKADGWEVDIFIHTWDMSSSSDGSWHKNQQCYIEKQLSNDDIEHIKKTYEPKVLKIEHLNDGERGMYPSINAGDNLRETYEEKNNIKYDYILYTRMDVLFASPLKISFYLDLYLKEERSKGAILTFPKLPEHFMFCGFNPFVRTQVIDSRAINEWDIVFFLNGSFSSIGKNIFRVMINYKIYRDFFLQRENFILGYDWSIEYKLKIANNEKLKLQNEVARLKNDFHRQRQILATTRIQNYLSYKLGKAIIENSRSILGYIRMPYVLSYIAEQHANELKNRKEKLPNIETLPDYKEALKYKEHLSYKLGEAFLKGCKTWYKGGLIKFYFEAKKLQKEYKK